MAASGHSVITPFGGPIPGQVAGNSAPAQEAGTIVAKVTLGGTPILWGVVYDGNDNDWYVTSQYYNNVTMISGATDKALGSINVGTYPAGVCVDAQSGGVYVVNSGSNNMSIISGTLVAYNLNIGTNPVGIACDGGNGDVFATNAGSNSVSMELANSIQATTPVGVHPDGVAVDTANHNAYVANYGSDNVSYDQGGVSFISIGVGTSPQGVAYDGANSEVYVTNAGSANVSVISTSTNKVIANIAVGAQPMYPAYDSGNALIYVPNAGSNTVSVINTTTNTVVATILGGLNVPTTAAYDPNNGEVFVTNQGTNYVSVISTELELAALSGRTARDVGQPTYLSAPIVAPGAGGLSATVAVSPSSGLTCSAATVNGFTNVSTSCTAITPGTYTVNVTATDAVGKSVWSLATLTISSDPSANAPTASPSSDDVGQTTDLSAIATSGSGAPTYLWNGLPTGCSSIDSLTLSCTPTAAGTSHITVSVTDSNGYTATSPSLVLVVSPALGTASLAATPAILDVGQNLKLTATDSGGSGSYSYTWRGLPPGCLGGNYSVINCAPAGPGSFTLKVWVNDSNKASSSATTGLTVSSDPAISAEPSSTVIDSGQMATLTSIVTGGTAPFTWQWYDSGGAISGASGTGATATYSTTVAHTGIYVVFTDTVSKFVTSTPTVSVVVNPDPAISTQPTSVAIDSGQTATLTSTVTGGTAPFVWRWYDGGGAIAGAQGSGVTATYTTAVADTGIYVVFTDFVYGQATSSPKVSVTVSPDPAISAQPSSTAIDAGQTATLTSTVTGGTAPFSWQWYDGGGAIAGASGTGAIATYSTTVADTGIYVVFTDSVSMTATSTPMVSVVVNPDPAISAQPSSTAIDAGQTATLTSTVTGGTAPFSWRWYDGGGAISRASGTGAAATYSTTVADTGIYVVFTDSVSMTAASSPTISVTVNADPTVAVTPGTTPVIYDVGHTATALTATSSYSGSNTITITWYDGSNSNCSLDSSSTGTSGTGFTVVYTPSTSTVGAMYYCVWATDSGSGVPTSYSNVVEVVVSTGPVAGTPTASPPAVDINQAVSLSSTVTGGSGGFSYLWSGLPTGCTSTSVNPLNCTPTASGKFTISVQITDSNGLSSTSGTLTLVVANDPTITSFSAFPNPITPGQTTYLNVSSTGGTGVFSYNYIGLPAGCTSSNTASLACVPTATGTFTVSVSASDTVGRSANRATVLTVNPAITLTSVTVSPNSASVTTGDSKTFTATPTCTGGTCPLGATYSWTLTSSALGTLNSTSTSSVVFTAGSKTGTETLFVKVTLGGKTVESSYITISITDSITTSPSSTPTYLLYGGVGAVVAVAVVAIILYLSRRGRSTHAPTEPVEDSKDVADEGTKETAAEQKART